MAILNITQGITGLAGVTPNLWLMKTNNTEAEVQAVGFLTAAHQEQLATFQDADLIAATTINAGVAETAWYSVRVSGNVPALIYSMVQV